MIRKRLDRFFLGFSFVQGISHRDDAMALCFFCELAREEKHEAMTSKTLSLALNVLIKPKGEAKLL